MKEVPYAPLHSSPPSRIHRPRFTRDEALPPPDLGTPRRVDSDPMANHVFALGQYGAAFNSGHELLHSFFQLMTAWSSFMGPDQSLNHNPIKTGITTVLTTTDMSANITTIIIIISTLAILYTCPQGPISLTRNFQECFPLLLLQAVLGEDSSLVARPSGTLKQSLRSGWT